MVNQKCALMECDLDGEPSLQEILSKDSKESDMVKHQAKLLIERHGFKSTDIFCMDCFWK